MNNFKNFVWKNYKHFALWSIIVLLPGIYFLVYYTGGTKFVYAHLMYIPIILAGAFFGAPFGVVAGIIGGIALGPVMPLDVAAGEAQSTINWVIRLAVFITTGLISGIAADVYKQKIKQLRQILWINPVTNIPNVFALQNLKSGSYYSIATVKLAYRDYLINIFGMEIFNHLIYKTYRNLIENLPIGSFVYQSDSDKLWCLVNNANPEEVRSYIINALDNDIIVKTANIYVEYYIGFGKHISLDTIRSLAPFQFTDACARKAQNNNVPFVNCDQQASTSLMDTDLLSDFYNALKNEETYLAYHPIYDLENMEIFALEALIRWNHPVKGLINPNDFIPLIENTQLVHPLMDWVFNKIIEKAEEFQKNGIKAKIFMNISAKNFYNQNLVYKVTKKLHEHNIDPSLIGFEITESVVFSNIDESQEMVKQLSDLGVKISIDDFGKGYSSLGYLSRFDIDFLKIDKSFISRLDNPTNLEVIKATINLAKQLKFMTVAEGVEELENLNKTIEIGFNYAQGFYFCKPIPQVDIIEYYKEHQKVKKS